MNAKQGNFGSVDEPEHAPRVVVSSLEDVEARCERIQANNVIRQRALSNQAALHALVAAQTKEVTDPLDADDAISITAIRQFVTENQKSLRVKYGKTIKISGAVVKWFIRPKVILPTDTAPMVNFLFHRRNGRKHFLEPVWVIKKDALQVRADSRLRRILFKRFGAWIGDVEHLTLKVDGLKSPIPLSEKRLSRRVPRRSR